MVRIPSKASFCQRPDDCDDEGREKVGDADLLFVPEDVPSDAEDESGNQGADCKSEQAARYYGPRIDNCTDSNHEIILAQSGGPGCR